eukprot:gene7468-8893_t
MSIKPNVLLGHCVGEFVAACLAGVFSVETALKLLCKRGELIDSQSDGILVALAASREEVCAAIEGAELCASAFVSCINGPEATVVGATIASAERLVGLLGCKHRIIEGVNADHCKLLAPVASEFREVLCTARMQPPALQWISSITGTWVGAEASSPDYWLRQLLEPTQFTSAVETLRSAGDFVCVELGTSFLINMATACLDKVEVEAQSWIPLLSEGKTPLASGAAAITAIVSGSGFESVTKAKQDLRSATQEKVWGSCIAPVDDNNSLLKECIQDIVWRAALQTMPRLVAAGPGAVTVEDSLVSLGLNSVSAIELRSRILEVFSGLHTSPASSQPGGAGLGLRVGELLASPTIQAIASGILSQLSRSREAADVARTDRVDVLEKKSFAASSLQRGMVFHHLANPERNMFVISYRWRLAGALDVVAFRAAWQSVVHHVPALRTRFDLFSTPEMLQIVEDSTTLDLPFELRVAPRAAQGDTAAEERLAEDTLGDAHGRGLALDAAPLFRILLLQLAPDMHELILTIHHTVMDAWSVRLLLDLVQAFYLNPNAEVTLPPSPSYLFHVRHEAAAAASGSPSEQFWRDAMQGYGGPRTLVAALPASQRMPGAAAISSSRTLDRTTLARLEHRAAQLGVTLGALCHAAWAVVQLVYGADSDGRTEAELVYGCTSSGRSAAGGEALRHVVGPVVNTTPMRLHVNAATTSVDSLAQLIYRSLLRNLEHESYPLAAIQQLCGAAKGNGEGAADGHSWPLFFVIVDFQSTSLGFNLPGGVTAGPPHILDQIGTPLSIRFMLHEDGGGERSSLIMMATSETTVYNARFLHGTLANVARVLEALADQPEPAGCSPMVADLGAHVETAWVRELGEEQAKEQQQRAEVLEARSLPPPELPCISGQQGDGMQGACRGTVLGEDAERLRIECRRRGVPVEAAVCAAYSLMLDRFSALRRFAVLAADPCGDLTALEVHVGDRRAATAGDLAIRQQRQLANMAHGGKCGGGLVNHGEGGLPVLFSVASDIGDGDGGNTATVDTSTAAAKSAPWQVAPTGLLFCLHAAGACSQQFEGWAEELLPAASGRLKAVPLDLPGHGTRRGCSAPLTSVGELVGDLTAQIEAHIASAEAGGQGRTPYALFGISMGALLAYEVACAMTARGCPPLHLFVASEAAPWAIVPDIDSALSNAEMVQEMHARGWLPEEVLEAGPEVWAAVLQLFRADLAVEAGYAAAVAEPPRLQCAVSAYAGEEDTQLAQEGCAECMHDWARVTASANVSFEVLPGGHLFPQTHTESRAVVLRAIARAMSQGMWEGRAAGLGGGDGPQVATALRCQVLDSRDARSKGEAGLQWDLQVLQGIFPKGVVEGMAGAFQTLLDALCHDAASWDRPVSELLPPVRAAVPVAPERPLDGRLLQEPFLEQARACAGRHALVHYGAEGGKAQQLSYGELEAATRAVARVLRRGLAEWVAPEEDVGGVEGTQGVPVVAVVASKGWEQVVGAMAALRVGGAYLPINITDVPQKRVERILYMSRSAAVLCDAKTYESAPWLQMSSLPVICISEAVAAPPTGEDAGEEALQLRSALPGELAYLIYTSGSTGVPKGVCCPHGAAINTLTDLNERFDIGPEDRAIALSSLSFDLSVYDIFGMLAAGAALVVPPAPMVNPPDPGWWLQTVREQQVTVWNTVPAFMELLVSHAEMTKERLPACLRLVMMSGDWIPTSLPERIRALSDCPRLRIVSLGGATEAAVWSNMFELDAAPLDPAWKSIPYGRPLRNQTMLVLDEHYQHCEPWVTGVIYIGGAGVALGYYGDAAKTAFQFVRHPVTGEALFRTGDLGRLRPDGNLEILGREDSQVKVNGLRIELGEIEHALASHPLVADACATVFNLPDGQPPALVAFALLSGAVDSTCDTEALLKGHMGTTLPALLVPRSVHVVPRMPLNANGKVDRKALAALHEQALASSPPSDTSTPGGQAPCTALERQIHDIWCQVLGVAPEALGVEANFFAVGGDSLRSLQVVSRAMDSGMRLTVRQIFANPSIRALAAAVAAEPPEEKAANGNARTGSGGRPGLGGPFELREDSANPTEPFPLIGIARAYFIGLHHSPFAPQGINPQMYFEWEWKGRCDVTRLEAAINAFVARHPSWRAVVRPDGMMQQLEDVPRYTLAGATEPADATPVQLMAIRDSMRRRGPRPHAWPLFDCHVSHLGPDRSRVHLTVNLFILDGVTDYILRYELSMLYRDLGSLPAPPALLYKDYCRSLTGSDGGAGYAASAEYRRAKAWWWDRIETLPPPPDPPIVVAEDDAAPSGLFEHIGGGLTPEQSAAFKKACARRGVTPTAGALCVYAQVVGRFSRSKHFMLNIVHCVRHPVHADVATLAGNFSSSFLLEADLRDSAGSMLDYAQQLGEELTTDLEHAGINGVEVMERYNQVHGSTGAAVAPFVFVSALGLESSVADFQKLAFEETFLSEATPGAWVINAVKEHPDGRITFGLEVLQGIFPKGVVEGMAGAFQTLLDALCHDAASWDRPVSELLPPVRAAVPVAPERPLDGRLLQEPFLEQARACAGRHALVHYGAEGGKAQQLSYGELEAATRAVARVLRRGLAEWVAPEEDVGGVEGTQGVPVVAVVASKGWEQVVGAMAALRVGGAYLPINITDVPQKRVERILYMSRSAAVLCDAKTYESAPWLQMSSLPVICISEAVAAPPTGEDAGEEALQLRSALPGELAYLIYTSGSTGVPKGVCCPHGAAINTLTDLNERFDIGPEDRAIALSSLSFDLSVYDIFGMLAAGAALVVPPAPMVNPPDPGWWLQTVREQQVTVWNTVPAFMELLVSHAEMTKERLPACLRLVMMSGDWIPTSLPERIRALSDCPRLRIVSLGGATEAAVWSNMFELDAAPLDPAWKSIPYGRPLRNQTMLVLDEHYQHCEPWVTGVIYIGGAGVALGYYGDAAKTAFQFVRHPVTGEALFRTGDLGRLRPDGNLEILGREDSQVKVNGLRIELGEIEHALASHPLVMVSAVTVHSGQLAAYITISGSTPEGEATKALFGELRAACLDRLPEYMLPQHFTMLPAIPLSPNGKVLRAQLPVPSSLSQVGAESGTITEPENADECAVRDTMAEILGRPAESICCTSSNFFHLGGSSLTALRLLLQLRQTHGLHVGIQQLFIAPTVQGICCAAKEAVENDRQGGRVGEEGTTQMQLVCLQKGQGSKAPLFLVHASGSSSMAYRPLTAELGDEQPVYALDDRSLTEGAEFTLSSIEAVAEQCAELIVHELRRQGGQAIQPITLGGWSYGGVVALQTAALLMQSKDNALQVADVRSVVLYDAPLGQMSRGGRATTAEEGGGHGKLIGDEEEVALLSKQMVPTLQDQQEQERISHHAAQHFMQCKRLLEAYDERHLQLSCRIVNVRPESSEYEFLETLEHLTSEVVEKHIIPGNHWTMLFEQHTKFAAAAIASYL